MILDIIKQSRYSFDTDLESETQLSCRDSGHFISLQLLNWEIQLKIALKHYRHTVDVNIAGRGPTMGFGNGIQTLSKIDLDDPEKHWEKFHHTLKQYQVCFIYHLNFKTFKNVPISESGPIHRC